MEQLGRRRVILGHRGTVLHPENLIILKVYSGLEPTEEEVEIAKKKFLEEHPDHKGHTVLDFTHLREERITPK